MIDVTGSESNRRGVVLRDKLIPTTGPPTFVLAVAMAAATPAIAQEEQADAPQRERETASVIGRVISASTGRPLEGAVVSFRGSGYGAITDSTGNFRIPHTWAGLDTVEVRYIGYSPSETAIEIEPEVTTEVVFLLSPTVVRIAELTVQIERSRRDVKLSGFEERRERGFGVFLTPRDIRRRNPNLASDVLRGVPGVEVGRIEHGRAPVYMTRGARKCPPAVYLDGVYQSGLQVDDIPREDVGAMEVYRGPSETPAEFQRLSRTCGAVVIWTPTGPDFWNWVPPEERDEGGQSP